MYGNSNQQIAAAAQGDYARAEGTAAAPQSRLQGSMHGLANSIGNLSDRVSVLSQRMGGVLHPSAPKLASSNSERGVGVDRPPASPAVNEAES